MKARLKISVLFVVFLSSSFAFYAIPPRSEAAITPVRIVQQIAFYLALQNAEASIACYACASAVVLFQPSNCEASIADQLCASVTSFLNDEAAKADADLKACKDKCGWKKRKDDLVNAARKKAKESCSKGEAPDINELSKGLDRNAKDRLKGLYDRNSRMFDGKAKLEAANFGTVSSKNTTITGKGGKITDLKSSEPDIPKLNSGAEFSLSGTKLSGKTLYSAATKQPQVLLASTASAKVSTNTVFASSQKPAVGAALSAKAAASATGKSEWDYENCAACLKGQPGGCFGICCKEQPNQGWCQTYCGYGNQVLPPEHEDYPEGNAGYCNCCKQYNSNCYVPYYCPSDSGTGTGIVDKIKAFFGKIGDLWHKYVLKEEKCGGGYYKIETQCCTVKNTIADICGSACPNPDKEYCENQKICEKTCSAGVISATPTPTNGEVILPIGETATLTVSGEKGDALGWSSSGGTLTPSADKKQATITSLEPGKITVTFGSKNCSKCRTSIVVAFVKVTKINPTGPITVFRGETIQFTITTQPSGAVYMKLVGLIPEAAPKWGIDFIPPPASMIEQSKSLDEGTFVIKFTAGGYLRMRAKAGNYDPGIPTDTIQVLDLP